MARFFFVLGAVSAALAVALGAFAAHGLRGRVAPELLQTFETGARYHMYHALGLLAAAWAATRWPGGATTAAGWLFVAGTVLFAGSLYLLVLTGQRWLGAVTPLGGAAFVAGWLALAWAALAR
ncbi:MAG: hypothetical protein A3E31_04675 [Candidatus Rokubacteria bacterium RIFCSPHIGHO2_12_FULL_73_22]|nr:MAG: hypothetical protein A3E31_04675 [Candidatus Rokubacteria bacterium RIFCSPHIGHO2_12_FULL_73_22]OGL29068.1 MAG: hypothetical protein A3G44_13275 [Candidatus Rokubacteria bacterium RIFCSPLOWO2_12_FULL_73_47]